MGKMKNLCIIQARMNSSRLPGKVLMEVNGVSLLEYQIKRIRLSKKIDKIVVATSTNKNDGKIQELCKKIGVDCFRGSENDVLLRYFECAKKYPDFANIVRLTGDCPLVDPAVIDQTISFFEKGKYDLVSNAPAGKETFPDGMDVEIFTKKSLEEAQSKSKLPVDREHPDEYILHENKFCKGYIFAPKNYGYLRLTVDNLEDFEVIKFVIKNSKITDSYLDYVYLLSKNPHIMQKNKHFNRNQGFVKNGQAGIKLWNKAKKIIPGGTQLLSKRPEMFLPEHWPCYFQKAKGCEVWDLDGNKYIDMYSMGIGSCVLGYADPDVNKSVKKVIDQGNMCTLNSPEEVELAELMLKLHPWAQKVRYARTGGEAIAMAVRIARAHTGKDGVAFCGYHGWHDWYLTANLADNKNLDGHLIPGLEPKGVPRALKGTALPFCYNNIEELEEIVAKNKNIGVIVLEPIRYKEPKNNFLQKVRKIADKINAVLIFDEISSGFRFNIGGAHLKYKVYPDIAVYAKAISNGYPMAAVIGKKNVMESSQDTFISSTYWTERIGPVAAIATIKKMLKNKVPQKLGKTGLYLMKNIRKIVKKHNIKMEITGLPALMHFSFKYGERNLAIQTFFTQEMLKRGIIASAGIYVCYVFKKEHIKKYLKGADEVFGILSQAIKENKVEKLLKGPVAHSGFKRLT